LYWFASRGIVDYNAGFIVFIAETLISFIIYGFQMWQETSVINDFSAKLHPAAAKPLPEENESEG
jgi:hypothetical protein